MEFITETLGQVLERPAPEVRDLHRAGATLVVLETFDPLLALASVQKERCTALYGVPTMFIAELNHPMFAMCDLSSLRTGIMAGSPCPMEIMKRVRGEHLAPRDRRVPAPHAGRAGRPGGGRGQPEVWRGGRRLGHPQAGRHGHRGGRAGFLSGAEDEGAP